MLRSLIDDIRRYLASGNMISRIIIINAIVFVALIFVKIGLMSTGDSYGSNLRILTKYISLNGDMWFNITHPWVFITHAFTHFSFFHILFNMLMLYWFGRIVGDLIGDRKILPIYFLGIMAGIIFFWLSAQFLMPGPQLAYGASAGVMAIIVAAGFISPDYVMNLILIGPVRLKYIVAVLVVLDLLAITNQQNLGGHAAHIGGAVMGGLFVVSLRNGRDLSVPINKGVDWITNLFSPSEPKVRKQKSPLTVSFKSEGRRARSGQQSDNTPDMHSSSNRLDEILDKIKEKGIDSLSKEEKAFLDEQSKQ